MRLKLEQWLIFIFFGFNIFLVGVISIAFYTQIRQSMLDRTLQQLQSINILKKNLIHNFLANKDKELNYLLNSMADKAILNEIPEELVDLQDLRFLVLSISDTMLTFPSVSTLPGMLLEDTIPKGITAYSDSTYGYLFTYRADFTARLYFNMDYLQQILMERTGLGTSGESYLVNSEGVMQTRSRFYPLMRPSEMVVNTYAMKKSLQNDSGEGVYSDYRGVTVLGAYRLLKYDHIDWVLLTEIDFAEAMQPVNAIKNRFLVISGFIFLLSFLISILVARNISKPVHQLFLTLQSLSRGVLPKAKVEEHLHVKELDQITRAINQLIVALRRISYFASSIGRGKFDRKYELLSDEDELGNSIVAMRDQLVILNQQNEDLEKANKRLLLETEEKERERISRDLHDGIGPLLTAIKFKITANQFPNQEELLNMIDETLQEVRRLSRNLMPALIRDFGPGVALEQLVNDLKKNLSAIEINFVNAVLAEKSKINNQMAIAIYRIGQESLNNAIIHANATQINMSVTEFDDHVNLYIQDNGHGFSQDVLKQTTGKGIRNIKERVHMLNGDLIIESNKDGTAIEAIIPIT